MGETPILIVISAPPERLLQKRLWPVGLLQAMQVFAVSSPIGDKDSLASLKVKASGEVTGFSPMTRCAPTLGL